MIIRGEPPSESSEVVAEELVWAIRTGSLASRVGQPVRAEALTALAPHPVFAISVEDIRQDATPAVSGWRYLLELDEQVVAQASTYLDDDGHHRFGGFGVGPRIKATVAAIRQAEELLGDDPEPLTLAAVEVPAELISLLQLTHADGSARGFLVVEPERPFAIGRLYTPAEMRTELLRVAKRVSPVPRTDRAENTRA
jgi:hypothetical protein